MDARLALWWTYLSFLEFYYVFCWRFSWIFISVDVEGWWRVNKVPFCPYLWIYSFYLLVLPPV